MKLDQYHAYFIDDGLGLDAARSRYRARRSQLLRQNAFPIAILGSPDLAPDFRLDAAHSFILQDPHMLYLTGVNQKQTALLLEPQIQTLFLPKFDAVKQHWEGNRLWFGESDHLDKTRAVTGFSQVSDSDQFDAAVRAVIESKPLQFGLIWHEDRFGKIIQDHHYTFMQHVKRVLKKYSPKTKLVNVAPFLFQMRLIHDAVAIRNFKEAHQKTAAVFHALLQEFLNLKSEHEVAGFLDGQIAKESYFRNSFPTMVASGAHALTLHYRANMAPFLDSGLCLLDFGLRWQNVTTDISRVLPLNGQFNPLERLLYQIVLDAQTMIETQVRPEISLMQLDQFCWDFINDELKKQIIAAGGTVQLNYKHAPHRVGHAIGIDVHDGDSSGHYRKELLQSGMVISNEPGVYGTFSLTIDGQHFHQAIGIRLEDDLLITKNGCENLSLGCPKSIEAIESLLA